MARLRFVHAADLHLDSPFVGLRAQAPENVAAALRSATFDAYANLIDLCVEERADALLVAGDVYDSSDRSLRAQLRFVEGLGKLDAAGIRSFVCHGNHDPLDGWEARLDYPPGCTRFGPEFTAAPVFPGEPGRAVVHGISYPTRVVTDNLVERLGEVDPGPFTIGLIHANVGNNPDHDPYAPCSLEDLRRSGVDYWALGHVHTRQVMSERSPAVVYPGNSQGRHPGETGPRGAYLVDVDDGGAVRLDFRALDIVRWERLEVDISGMETEQDLISTLHGAAEAALDGAGGRPVVLRISLEGRGALHGPLRRRGLVEELREDLNGEWAGRAPFAWCERVEDGTSAVLDRERHAAGSDFLAEVLRTADRAGREPELAARLRSELDELYLHHRYRRHLRGHEPEGGDLAALVGEAEEIAADLLLGDDG